MFTEFTGKQYLKIDIANSMGFDKDLWGDRIAWTEAHMDELEKLTNDAKEPALFFAGVQALRKAQRGEVSHYPVSLDATASGIQILSSMASCAKSAAMVNLIDTGKREDVYTTIPEVMTRKVGGKVQVTRDQAKDAIMPAYYTSKKMPREVFGDGPVLIAFYEAVTEETPGAWELNTAFSKMWNPNAYSNDWVLPDNYHVHIKVMDKVTTNVDFINDSYSVQYEVNQPKEEGRSLGANATHSVDGFLVREMNRRCNYDPVMIHTLLSIITATGTSQTREKDKLVMILWGHYLKSGFLSARILPLLDSKNLGLVDAAVILELIESMPRKPFKILAVHDCFRCLPNHANDLRRQYNLLMSTLARSNFLSFLISQIVGRELPVSKRDNIADLILEAEYALS